MVQKALKTKRVYQLNELLETVSNCVCFFNMSFQWYNVPLNTDNSRTAHAVLQFQPTSSWLGFVCPDSCPSSSFLRLRY